MKKINVLGLVALFVASGMAMAFNKSEANSARKFHPTTAITYLPDGKIQFSGDEITDQEEDKDYLCSLSSEVCSVEGEVISESGSLIIMEPSDLVNGSYED